MENIGVASPLMAIKVFLKNSIAQAEMKVWSRMNKNVDKTDVQMLKMSQELHKKMSEYFHIQSVKDMGDVFSPR